MPRPENVTPQHRAFGNRVKVRRESLGLTPEELASKVGGVTPRTIRAYEAGERIPDALGPDSEGSRLCKALSSRELGECEMNWLYRANTKWMDLELVNALRDHQRKMAAAATKSPPRRRKYRGLRD